MSTTERAAPLANRRQKPIFGAEQMTAIKDLARNPVPLTIVDGAGQATLTAERGPAGKLWLTCSCAANAADGWCRHSIDVLSQRYAPLGDDDIASVDAFERIMAGTRARTAGQYAGRTLKAFDVGLKRFDDARPEKIDGRSLGKFTDLVSDVAATAAELEDALSALMRLLERS